MHFGKSALSALLVVSSVGLAAGPAHADAVGTGTARFLGLTCGFTYHWDGGPPPAPRRIRSMTVGADCAVQGSAWGTITFTGGDNVVFTVDMVATSPMQCKHTGALHGTYQGGTSFDFPEQPIPETTGKPDCPNPGVIAITTD